jgi:hypothetical protein
LAESPRRFQRSDDSVPPWTATPRDRRTRDLAPPSDGKWKRGVSFEDKTQTSQDSPGGANLKYSVLDKMVNNIPTFLVYFKLTRNLFL